MSNHPRRINPHRPFVISANGLKRIVLGTDTGSREVHLTSHAAVQKPFRTTQSANRHFLVIVHSDRGALEEHAKEVIAAAALLADELTKVVVVAIGEINMDVGALGADIVVNLAQPHYCPQTLLTAVIAIITHYQPAHIFIPDRHADGDLGRRLAAHTKRTIATDVVELGVDYALRPIPGNNTARCALPQIVLLARHVADTNLPFIGHGTIETVPVEEEIIAFSVRDLGIETTSPDTIGLDEADFIMSAGNGMRDLSTFSTLAELLGASVGASRVAVDDGRFSRDKQIGATGKTVQSRVYMALGISGAVQHLQGIKDCRHVIAVNLDESAPIAQRADVMVVEDTQKLMRALVTQLHEAKQLRPSQAEQS